VAIYLDSINWINEKILYKYILRLYIKTKIKLMANQGVSGLLVRKTVQPYSLRQDHSNFNDFKSSNIVSFINKKIGDLRG
jgi:hypothetical protein